MNFRKQVHFTKTSCIFVFVCKILKLFFRYYTACQEMPQSDYLILGAEIAREQCQETFLAPSADKQTRNYDTSAQTTIPPTHHKALGLGRRKIKWRAVYANLQRNAIVRGSHPQSRDSQGHLQSHRVQTCFVYKKYENSFC